MRTFSHQHLNYDEDLQKNLQTSVHLCSFTFVLLLYYNT